MAQQRNIQALDHAALDDTALVAQVLHGDRDAFRDVMRRCNQRLFRVARGLTNSDAEAEDVVQDAYVRGFESLSGFRGDASLLTWFTRIVMNEANGRLRSRKRLVAVEQIEAAQMSDSSVIPFPGRFGSEDPASSTARDQARGLLEHAIDQLPDAFRLVYILREVEDCSIAETAAQLNLRAETVKTRLHRARRLLREALHDSLSESLSGAFPFLGTRCQSMTDTVMQRLEKESRFEQLNAATTVHKPDTGDTSC